MQRKPTMVIAGIVIGIFGVAWFYGAPYLVLKEMKAAAQAGNAEDLAEYVDFPAVRESIKGTLKASLMRELENDQDKNNPFAALGMAMAGAMIDPMVEAFVSPSGIAGLMAGRVSPGDKMADESAQSSDPASDAESVQMGYEGFGKFIVRIRPQDHGDNKGADLVLRRHGLSWKLVTVRIL